MQLLESPPDRMAMGDLTSCLCCFVMVGLAGKLLGAV